MRAMIMPVVMAMGLAMPGEATASGGLGCEGDAGKAKFTIESGVTRGMGSPVFQFRGQIETTDRAIQPDLRKVAVTGEHLAQYWLDGEELRMVLYRERAQGDHGYVELTVLTRTDGEGGYSGRFEIVYFETAGDTSGEGKTIKAGGEATCFVE